MLTYYSETPRTFKNHVKSTLPVLCKWNNKAGMTAYLFTTWFAEYFKPNVKSYCSEKFPLKILHSLTVNLVIQESLVWICNATAKSLQLCLTLCDPIDSSPPGSPVPGILQARTLEWVAISFSNAWEWKVKVKSLSLTLRDPMDCCLPGSSIHQIFQARILEWVVIAFSMDLQWN